jgi:hypothetical protein
MLLGEAEARARVRGGGPDIAGEGGAESERIGLGRLAGD